MTTRGVPRILCMSNIGVGGSGPWVANHVVIPLFLRWLLPIIEDKERMEAALRASPVEWVSVRLASITSGPVKPVRTSVDGRGIGLTITAASTARFRLDQTTSTEWVGAAPSISNERLSLVSMTPNLRRIQTRLGAIALEDQGTGTPVVLWPSLFSDHRLYAHVVALLGHGWRTLRIDGPGFGQSDPPNGEVQPWVYADVVLEILDSLGVGQALVAGCSWGGQVAAHIGVRAPERVHGVLIMNAPLGPSRGGHVFELLGTRLFGSTAFWGRGVARSMFSAASLAAYPERVHAFAGAFTSFDKAAAARTARTVLTRFPGLADVLPRLNVPTTIMMGAEDRLYPVERMRPLAALASGAHLEIVPACGHLAPLEAPSAVVGAIGQLAINAGIHLARS
jgi:3-oxoadipate enol-lactonase